MIEITSRENKVFKDLVKLKNKKYRRQIGLCVVEGGKVVKERLESGGAEKVFVRASAKSQISNFGKIVNNKLFILDDKLFGLVSELETDQGVLAVSTIPKSGGVTFPYLVLDGIQDAGNMGTVLRTAAAFGFRTVFCLDCVDAFSAKVLRASSGLQFKLNIIELGMNEFIKPSNSRLLAADLGGDDISRWLAENAGGKQVRSNQIGLVLGSEGQGIHTALGKMADKIISIPMSKDCESLNVAVAGGIIMYLIKTQYLN